MKIKIKVQQLWIKAPTLNIYLNNNIKLNIFLIYQMDFTHLESLLSSLETKPDKIRALADYIVLNSSSSEIEVGKALQKTFDSMNLQKKLAIFYTISQILIISNQKREVVYFRIFGSKLKSLLQQLSIEVKDIRVMKDVCRTLDKWQQQQMFADNFMQKLKILIRQFYIKIKADSVGEVIGFKKYKKTFLMEINDIKNYSITETMYQNYCQYIQIQLKMTNINAEFFKIDLQKGNQMTQNNKRRCQQLMKMYNDLSYKLEISLGKIQKSFNSMRQWASQEVEILKKDSQAGQFKRRSSGKISS